MARQIINIGTVGNDGTGDAVREAFRKVNDNFRELYGALGLGEKLTFIGLTDTPPTYIGSANSIVGVNSNEDSLVFRRIIGSSGIDVKVTDGLISITTKISKIEDDRTPVLGGPLNTLSDIGRNPIFNLPSITTPSEVSSVLQSIQDATGEVADLSRVAANVGYVDTKLSRNGIRSVNPATNTNDPTMGIMKGPLVLDYQTTDEENLAWDNQTAVTRKYVDQSRSSLVNLYVASTSQASVASQLRGRSISTAFTSISEALQAAEQIVLQSPITLSPYRKELTYNAGTPATFRSLTDTDLTGHGLITEVIMQIDQVSVGREGTGYQPGDKIFLSGGAFSRPAVLEVVSVSNTPFNLGGVQEVKIVDRGAYSILPGASGVNTTTSSTVAHGVTVNVTYSVFAVTVVDGGQGYQAGSVRFLGGSGQGASGVASFVSGQVFEIKVTNAGSGYIIPPTVEVETLRMHVDTNYKRSDLTESWLREGMLIVGNTSGAVASIINVTGVISTSQGTEGCEIFEVDVISGTFEPSETLTVGHAEPAAKVCVLVESGVYYENFPLRIPQGVSLIGDSVSTTEIVPRRSLFSYSPWVFDNFFSSSDYTFLRSKCKNYYLTDPDASGTIPVLNYGQHNSAVSLINLNRTFIFTQIRYWARNYSIVNQVNLDSFLELFYSTVNSLLFDLQFGDSNRVTSIVLEMISKTLSNSVTSAVVNFLEYLSRIIVSVILNEIVYEVFDQTGSTVDPNTLLIAQRIELTYTKNQTSIDVVLSLMSGAAQLVKTPANLPKSNDSIDAIQLSKNSLVQNITLRDFKESGIVLNPVLPPNEHFPAKIKDVSLVTSFSTAVGVNVDSFIASQSGVITGADNNRELVISQVKRKFSLPAKIVEANKTYEIDYFIDSDFNVNNSTYQLTTLLDYNDQLSTAWVNLPCVLINDDNNAVLVTTSIPHELSNLSRVTFTLDSLPTGIIKDVEYQVEVVSPSVFKLKQNGATVVAEVNSVPLTVSRIVDLHVRDRVQVEIDNVEVVVDNGVGVKATNNVTVYATGLHTKYSSTGVLSDGGATVFLSNSITENGHYGLVSQGYDILETPSNVELYKPLAQGAEIILSTADDNVKGSRTILVKYDDYLPVPGSEVEVNHYDFQSHYEILFASLVSAVDHTARITIVDTAGLLENLVVGQRITIRQMNSVVLTGDVVDTTTKPSTALVLNDSDYIYRVVEFEHYREYDADIIQIDRIDTENSIIYTRTPHKQRVGYLIQIEVGEYDTVPQELVLLQSSRRTVVYQIHSVLSNDSFRLCKINETQSIVFSLPVVPVVNNTFVKPYGNALAQLKEGYNYINLDVNSTQSLSDPSRLIPVSTSLFTSNVILNSPQHGLQINTPIKFVADTYPTPVTSDGIYWVTRENFTENQFSVTNRATVFDFVTGTGQINGSIITGLSTTAGLYPGMRVIPTLLPDGSGTLPEVPVEPPPPVDPETEVLVDASPEIREFVVSSVFKFDSKFYEFYTFNTYTNFLKPLKIRVSKTPSTGTTTAKIQSFVRTHVISYLMDMAPTFASESMFVSATDFFTNNRAIVTRGSSETVSSKPVQINDLVRMTLIGQIIAQPEHHLISYGYTSTTSLLKTVNVLASGVTTPVQSSKNPIYLQDEIVLSVFNCNHNDPEIYAFRKNSNIIFGNVDYNTNIDPTPNPNPTPQPVIPSDGDWVFNPKILEVLGPTSVRISDFEYIRPGNIRFNAEGDPVVFSTDSVNAKVGRLNGDIGQITFEVTNVSPYDQPRIVGSEFFFEGNSYRVTACEQRPRSSLITLNRPLLSSVLKYQSGFVLKAAVPVPSPLAAGKVFTKISTLTAVSHTFKHAGSGSQTDVAAIDYYDKSVLPSDSVPMFTASSVMSATNFGKSIIQERSLGRVFYEGSTQNGVYTVGSFFEVDQSAGKISLSSQLALNHLAGLGFRRGVTINEFSVDDTMLDAANDSVPTEGAVKGFVARCLGFDHNGTPIDEIDLLPNTGTGGVMALSGRLPMKGNLNFNGNRGINLQAPQVPSDAARLDSITIANLRDTDQQRLIQFNNPQHGNLLILTGNGNKITNTTVRGHVVYTHENGQLVTSISPAVISDSHISATARIAQEKLLLNAATVKLPGTEVSQADLGVAAFDSTVFVSSNGLISLKSNSISLSVLENIAPRSLLGNADATTGKVSVIPLEEIVNSSGSIKKSQYTGPGYVKRITSTSGIPLDDSNFTVVDDASVPTPNTLVRRDANGDTMLNSLAVSNVKLTTQRSGSFVVLKTTEASSTSGYVDINAYNVPGVSAFTGIQIGNGPGINKTLYNNNSHEFRNQTGNITFAVVDATGIDILSRTLKVSTVSSGSNSSLGVLQGAWSITGTGTQPKVTVMNSVSLAEYCQGDSIYEPGTVLVYGGANEVTVSTLENDHRIAGVVTADAAYAMNGACSAPRNLVALQGRVECLVVGNIQKGDLIVSSNLAGVATSAVGNVVAGAVIGKAMQSYSSTQVGKIFVAVGR